MPTTKIAAMLTPPPRLGSLDAYRGLVMIALAARGFGLHATAEHFPENVVWQTIGNQFEHVPWVGCAFWDLIQPSFMFMAGVSLPFSFAGRMGHGQSWWQVAFHAFVRSVVLIFLGVLLTSKSGDRPNYEFVNVLTQIGLGYFCLFLLWNRPTWSQLLAAQLILIAYWAWFALTPAASTEPLAGFAAHWQKNANPAATFDVWFLNLFPRETPFVSNSGGYTTLNFIPSLATMIFGLMTGEAIRGAHSKLNVVGGLILCGLIGLTGGWALDHFGLCPLVKRIWTPGWTLFSTGWCWLILAGFYGIIDVIGFDAWAFPLKVAGMNSLVLYLAGQLLPGWTEATLRRFFGSGVFSFYQASLEPYEPLIRCNLVLLCFWLFVFWMYRQKLFVRI